MTSPEHKIIAIGGVGGSGTRLVADIAMKFGFYMGGSLNRALDNLWFTLLFQRPGWFERFPGDDAIVDALRLFRRAMTTGLAGAVSDSEIDFIHGLVRDLENASRRTGANRKVAERLIASTPPSRVAPVAWGWKEPNSHIFLPQIAAEIENIKYIHVLRNGFNMAFSTNQNQIRNWGNLVAGINKKCDIFDVVDVLEYWILANKRAVKIGKEFLNERFITIIYDKLCTDRESELYKLIDFLKIEPDNDTISSIIKTINPKTINKYDKNDISNFPKRQIEAVREFGFGVDGYCPT